MLLVAACSSPAAATPTESEAPTASPTVAATPEVTATEEPTPAPPGIGTQVQVGDEQYVTVTAVESWPGNDTQPAAAGNVFQTVRIRIDAITTTSFTSEDFTVQESDGVSYSESPPGRSRSPNMSFQNGLTPNTYWEAFVTFEVPAADADELVLVYSPDFIDAPVRIDLF